MAPIRSAPPAFTSSTRITSFAATAPRRPATAIGEVAWKVRVLFALNNKWVWGWDGTLLSDRTFLQDYNPRLSRYYANAIDPIQNPTGLNDAAVSQLYLAGKGNRSYFDARAIYYLGFSESDTQSQIPVIHPVIDYNYVFDRPILGGELGYRTQLHQPDAQPGRLRSDHPERARSTALVRKPPIPRSRQPPIACCAAFQAPTAVSRRSYNGGAASPTASARYSRPLLRCASTPVRCRSITILAYPISSTPVIPTWCAPCRP